MQLLWNLDAKLLSWALLYKRQVVWLFTLLYLAVFLLGAAGGYVTVTGGTLVAVFYRFANLWGQIAMVLFIFTLLPGILRRLQVTLPTVRTLLFFRRQLGIGVYVFALAHATVHSIAPRLAQQIPPSVLPAPFEMLGILALQGLFWLFITSNNYSVKKLGVWWKRLHRLVYVIAWLIFGHVALQSSRWAIPIAMIAFLEVMSFGVVFLRNWGKKPVSSSV